MSTPQDCPRRSKLRPPATRRFWASRSNTDFRASTNTLRLRASATMEIEMRNHNNLLGQVQGVDGIKTGYTEASGYNLVSSVRRDERHIVAVILGGTSNAARDSRMRQLIEEHISEAATQRTMPIIVEGKELEDAPVAAAAAAPPLNPQRVRVSASKPQIRVSKATAGMALQSAGTKGACASGAQTAVKQSIDPRRPPGGCHHRFAPIASSRTQAGPALFALMNLDLDARRRSPCGRGAVRTPVQNEPLVRGTRALLRSRVQVSRVFHEFTPQFRIISIRGCCYFATAVRIHADNA